MAISDHDIARVLSEALPYMQRYDDETIVNGRMRIEWFE